jgi:hypothetical protein
LGKPLSYFASAEADHGTGVGVVVGIAPENCDSKSALFQVVTATVECGVDKVSQQGGIALAASELMAGGDCIQFLPDQLTICFGSGLPVLRGIRRSRHIWPLTTIIKGEAYTQTAKIVTREAKALRIRWVRNRSIRKVR